MLRADKFLSLVMSASFLLCSCASTNEGTHGRFYDSALDDHNRPPVTMQPPLSSDGYTIDSLYMRTQADYYYSMGEAQSYDGNHQKAVEAFSQTLVYDPESSTVRLRLATEYVKTGMASEAIEQAEIALQKNPKNIDAHLLLGGLYSSVKSYDKAISEYEDVLKIEPKNLEAPLYLGAVYSEQKQFDKAIKYFEILTKNDDYQSPHLAWYYIGRIRMEQKEAKYKAQAISAFKSALKEKPDFSDAVIALASVEAQGADGKASISTLAKWQKEHGPSVKIAEVLSQYYLEKNDYDLAFEQFEVLERQGSDQLNVKLKMALILIEKKIYDKAISRLEDILKEAPESDKIRFYLGAVFEESKQPEKALHHYGKIPESSQYYEESVVHSAYLWKGMGKISNAIGVLEKGLELRQEQAQFHAMYAALLDESGDLKKAQSHLEKAVEKFPMNAQIRFYFGTILDKTGKKEQVVEQMQKVIELEPNHVQGLNYLAYTYAESGTKLDEAESLARRAVTLDPKDGYILDTLGWILFQKNSYAESLKMLEAAHKFQPGVSIIAEHLGDVYSKKQWPDKALRMYQRAMELESDQKKLDELKSKVTGIQFQRTPDKRLPASAGK